LLRLITGSLSPTKGRVTININKRCGISYVPQNPILSLLAPTVKECIELIISCCKTQYSNILKIIESLNLDQYLEYPIAKLSLGLRRRLALALALGAGSELILLDEPTTALDPETRSQVIDMLTNIPSNVSMIISTHDIMFLEMISNRIFKLRNEFIERVERP